MAALNYHTIMQGIQTTIYNGVTGIDGLIVGIERERMPDENPYVEIYLLSRRAVPERQRLAAGKRTDFLITFSIWCYGFGLSSQDACSIRDLLLGKVEIALMQDRTLAGTVHTSYIEGGEFTGLEQEGRFFRAGEVRLVASAHADY